jgi:aryl-alcohol dehydrogenase-like predicted oxidoreductase
MNRQPRPVGTSGVHVDPLGLGCWPLAGMTRSGITHAAAVATVAAALDRGIVHLDTAFCYGEAGESERAIAEALTGRRRDAAVIATKCGIHWEPGRRQCVDGRPERIRLEVETSLQRLGTDRVDLLYLHAPDPSLPIEESAGELARLLTEGKTRAVGASNVSLEQLQRFAAACPLSGCQLHYNMLQREIEAEILPWCRAAGVAMFVYWPLMKGLLAGEMRREQTFPATDSRHKYPMFNGDEFQRNLDFVETLRPVAARLGCALPDMVLAWTAERAGVTCVLFGATSPDQVEANVRALQCELDDDARRVIDAAITARGPVANRRAV